MKVQLPVGTGPIKSSRKYKTMTDNQKMIYDKVYEKLSIKTDPSIKSFEELLNVNMQEQFEVNFDEEF